MEVMLSQPDPSPVVSGAKQESSNCKNKVERGEVFKNSYVSILQEKQNPKGYCISSRFARLRSYQNGWKISDVTVPKRHDVTSGYSLRDPSNII